MINYSIKDLEQMTGIKAHTIRIWEQRFQFLQPNRSATNIRSYDPTQLKLILNIALLRNHGIKISEIAQYSNQQIQDKVSDFSNQKLNYPDQIQALTTSMLDFDEDRFEDILNENISKFGFENVMIHIIYPFLSKIGILWLTGSIGPAQEHFMVNLIRQKIIVAIDALPRKPIINHKTFVLYLPEGEFHEIGLLFAQYIFQVKGHKVIYLGQSLPFADLVFTHNTSNPDFIFTIITSSPNSDNIQEYLNNLNEKFPKTSIFITGYQVTNNNDLEIPKNITVISKIEELQKIVGWIS